MTTPQDERRSATSASNAAPDALCAGRHQAQLGIPDVATDDAAFGQAIHNALATDDISNLDTQQLSIYESCVEIRDKLVAQVFGPDASKVKVFKEQRFWCKVEGKWEHSAKPDFIARHGPKALVVEFKTLPGETPESPENQQLRDQGVLSARSLLFDEVFAAVAQPLVTHSPTIVRYDSASILKAEQEMWKRVAASNAPDAKRTAGEVQCKFCRAKLQCDAYALWSKSMLPAPVSIFDVPVAQWTPEQRATFCERESVARKWLDECKDEMKVLLKADANAIPGWDLVPGDTRRTITNPQELFERFRNVARTAAKHIIAGTAHHNTDTEEAKVEELILKRFMSCVGITKQKLETQVRAVTKLTGKGLTAEMGRLLEGITEEKQNEPSIGRKKL